ncbi:hypothetical protein [Desulfoscipio gibsoniae]|uniref:hypothetical protein n=1 Tax=Desulfoscipio gibsoniae TaxID=102134 RepID=UPI0012FEAB79|nr:hypothetical protein [Desulfoscipio gibsoniae]
MKYKNSAGSWVSMTDVNKVVKAHWPTNITPPAPVDYTVDTSYISSAKVYASIKF